MWLGREMSGLSTVKKKQKKRRKRERRKGEGRDEQRDITKVQKEVEADLKTQFHAKK